MRELLKRVEKEVTLDEWDKARYENSGYIRWESILHFFSIDCIKAGYLIKKRGIWYITPEGEEALKLGPEKLLEEAIQVQIKHRESTTSVQEVRQLMGLLQKEGNVGIFVSTSGFSPDARTAACISTD